VVPLEIAPAAGENVGAAAWGVLAGFAATALKNGASV